jgi:hypothetical protein
MVHVAAPIGKLECVVIVLYILVPGAAPHKVPSAAPHNVPGALPHKVPGAAPNK